MRAAAVTVLTLLVALSLVAPALGEADVTDTVEIRRTAFGVPHITASDHHGLGYGYGYAFAEDNICTAADFYVTVRGERSRYFGPDEGYTFRGNGTSVTNLASDLFFTDIIDRGVVEGLVDQAPPSGPLPDVRAGVSGYVEGYNAYLAEVGVDGITDPRCAGGEWVQPITEIDAYRRFYQLALLASSGVAIDGIGGAAPLTGDDADALDLLDGMDPDAFDDLLGIGSNAWGLGKDVTDTGRGIVLGNPHFPWFGGERLYQAHMTIPGKLDVAGASLYGVPIILIGHTENMAWSHTVSTAFRFTPYEVTLVPGSPTTYLLDGEPTRMEANDVTVVVRGEDGELSEVTRTMYRTVWGPMMTEILNLPIFPWTPAKAFAMGDVNADNFRYLNHFFEKNHAQSVRELYEVQTRNQGVPWVNTIAADSSGEAYYADISVVPNVPDELLGPQCLNSPVGLATFELLGLPILDGSQSACAWRDDDDAIQPGTFGPANLPHLFRDDFVANGNDSYWLTNPAEPLTGFARIIGDEDTERTLRTRLGLVMLAERIAGTDGLAGTGFTVEQVKEVALDNRQHAGELTRDAVVDLCRSLPGGLAPSTSGPVDVGEACDVLADWDLRDDLDSAGAVLFRRFWVHASAALPSPWQDGYDSDDPVGTPRELRSDDPQMAAALGDAVADLEGAAIPLDAGLRGWQYENRSGDRVPVHGGPGVLGVFNAVNAQWNAEEGYSSVPHGTSFVMVVGFTDGCPDAWQFTTYSQSEDATSPHFNDQAQRFADKEWIPMHFCRDDVVANTVSVTTLELGGGPDAGSGDGDGDGGGVEEIDAQPVADNGDDGGEASGEGAGAASDPAPVTPAPALPATGGGLGLALAALLGTAFIGALRRP